MNYASQIAAGDLPFGLSLMSHLGEGNVPISPASVRMALAMLYEGARGYTAREISQTAFIPEDVNLRQQGFRELTDTFNAANTPYTLRCANGVWVVEKYQLAGDFQGVLAGCYRAESGSADFEGNPEGERRKINQWVSGKTEGRIPDLFQAGSINPQTVLALANALYFKAPWENKFDPRLTQKQGYTLSSGERVQVDMMRKGEIELAENRIYSISPRRLPEFLYGHFDGAQMVMLPYKRLLHDGCQLANLILLPPRGSSVKSLEAHLRDNNMSFEGLRRMMGSNKFVRLEIPGHEVRGNYDLKAPLRAMGMERMFRLGDAEFSGIGAGPLAVSEGVHQTFFRTNEEGSEGAAATGFGVLRGMDTRKPVEFVADRPFLEAVVDTNTGAFIFLNRIEDPR